MTPSFSITRSTGGLSAGVVPQAKERMWIATADGGRDMVPFLEALDGMLKRGVGVRLIHVKEPGPNRRNDFDIK